MGLFKGENFRHVKKLKKTADKIELLADSYAQLTNEQLQEKRKNLKREYPTAKNSSLFFPKHMPRSERRRREFWVCVTFMFSFSAELLFIKDV